MSDRGFRGGPDRERVPERSESGYPEAHDTCISAADLMLRIRAGDDEALQQLIEKYWSRLVRYASQLLDSADDAKDVAQEVFVRTWEHRARWNPTGSVETYLYRIARNLSLLQLRRRDVRRRTQPEVLGRLGEPRTPIDDVIFGELRGAFDQALRELPVRRREAFLLVRVDGLGLREAAEIMGLTRRTVANHVYLAVCDLEKALLPFLRQS